MSFPNEKQISDWKLQYGEIFSCDGPDGIFIYRRMTISEFCNIDLFDSGPKQENYIINTCLLWKDTDLEIDQINASFITNVVNDIIVKSGWSDPNILNNYMNKGRMLSGGAAIQMVALICKVFTTLNPLDVMEWSIEKICLFNALAETISNTKIKVNIEDPNDPTTHKENGESLGVVCKRCGYNDMVTEPGTLCPKCGRSRLRKPYNWHVDNSAMISKGIANLEKDVSQEELEMILQNEKAKKEQKFKELKEKLKNNIQNPN